MSGSISVVKHARDEIEWPFRGEPLLRIGDSDFGRRTVVVDPIPSYAHDAALVARMLDRVARAWPVIWPVTFHVLPCEETARTNAATFVDFDYRIEHDKRDQRLDYTAHIVLSAKRIMPHPAMTRYLVAHEYGHVVEDFLNTALRGNHVGTSYVEEEYADVRQIRRQDDGGGGRWHTKPGEVLANDFRVWVCDIECEFWPHPGIPQPHDAFAPSWGPGAWWREQRRLCAEFVKTHGKQRESAA